MKRVSLLSPIQKITLKSDICVLYPGQEFIFDPVIPLLAIYNNTEWEMPTLDRMNCDGQSPAIRPIIQAHHSLHSSHHPRT